MKRDILSTTDDFPLCAVSELAACPVHGLRGFAETEQHNFASNWLKK